MFDTLLDTRVTTKKFGENLNSFGFEMGIQIYSRKSKQKKKRPKEKINNSKPSVPFPPMAQQAHPGFPLSPLFLTALRRTPSLIGGPHLHITHSSSINAAMTRSASVVSPLPILFT